MVLRYVTGSKTRKNAKSVQQQAQELLNTAISIIDTNDGNCNYDELLQLLRKYTSDVICSCHDHMGNTVFHMIFSRQSRPRFPNDSNEDGNNLPESKPHRWVSRRRERSAADEGRNRRKVTLLQVVQYLVQCSDVTTNEFANDEGLMGSDPNPGDCNTSWTGILRQKSAGGSLPLHVACRFRYTSEHQQIDVIQYIVDAYPYAARCPDMWGNLPLHEACDVNSSNVLPPIEIVILLIQIYPESIRVANIDGNLPLHLIASASKHAFSVLQNLLAWSDEVNDGNAEEIEEHAPRKQHYDLSKASSCINDSFYELRQLEIVEYMVSYWPESVHITNNRQETALQLALVANTNISMIDFLQTVVNTIDPLLLPNPSNTTVQNGIDVDDNFNICRNQATAKTTNPFDDDSEILNATMTLSVLSEDEVPDVQFPSNIIDTNYDDEESDSDFDGTVELAEDYFEVVVIDRIDERSDGDDHYTRRGNDTAFMEEQEDLYWTSSHFESAERFVSPNS